jgi:predicted nuclease with TOPRIM domain
MLEPTSSDEELDFQPTHHNNTLDSIDSDGFDDEVERNTLANSQTTTDPLNGSSITEDGTHQYLTDNSLEATTQWLVNFVSEKNQLQVRSVSDSTQRTVSSASLSPLDLEEPIRHTSPLNPPCEDEGDVSNLDNLNNSSEWVVPGDLSFGNDTLPRLDGASFSIAGMVDPDATGATVRGIAPRRPLGLPGRGEVPAIFKTASSPTKDDEMTPIAPMRTRLAASKYVSTTPIKGTSSSPSATPRLGTSPRGSPPALFGSGVRHNPIEESVPMLAISSPVPSPGKVSPVLPSVSEDEEHEHSSTEVEIKPKGPLFGSLTRSRPSAFPVGLGIGRRRPRSVFDEDDDDSHSDASPTKPILDGKAVSSLTGDMSKLSLVDLSGNASASKLSFLDRTSDSSGVLSPAAGGNMSNTSDSSTGSTNATAALLGAQGNALIGAHAEYAQSLEQQIAKLHSVLAACQAELSARDAMVNKFLPMRDDIIRMQEEMKAKAKENKELRAKLSSAEQSQAATKEQLESVEGERAQLETRVHTVEHETNELKAHLAEAEHAKEELQAEVDALHAGQPSRNYKDESEDLHEQLKFAEDELAFARSQLERTADEAANAREELEATKGELQASQDECGHLRADLEAAHDECERLGADLDTTRSELDAARSSSTAAASDLEDKLLAARQEIDEFKAQLRYVHETTDDLKHALHEAHDEADALRAQLADAKTATSDTQAELHETRDKCTSLESELETVHGTVDDLRADMDAARADYDHVRAEADHEALARADAERAVRSLEDKVVSKECVDSY